jgi:hypothetical protein
VKVNGLFQVNELAHLVFTLLTGVLKALHKRCLKIHLNRPVTVVVESPENERAYEAVLKMESTIGRCKSAVDGLGP